MDKALEREGGFYASLKQNVHDIQNSCYDIKVNNEKTW